MDDLDEWQRSEKDRRKRQKSNHDKKRTNKELIHDQRVDSLASLSTDSPTASSMLSISPAVEEHRRRLAQYLRSRNYPRQHGILSPTSTSHSSQPQYFRESRHSVSRSPTSSTQKSSQKVRSTLTSLNDTTNTPTQSSSRKRKRTPTGESPTRHKTTKLQSDLSSSDTATAQRQNDNGLDTGSVPHSTQNRTNGEVLEQSSEKTPSESHAEDDLPTSGVFQDTEMKIVYETVESFRTQNQLSQTALNSLIQESSRKKGTGIKRQLWDDLYKALPNRPKYSVANFVRRKYHNYEKRGIWTAEEDEQLRQAYAVRPNQWVEIGKELGRMGGDCRDRWRNYLSCEDIKTQRWTEVEEMELSIAVEECKEAMRHKYQRKAVEERKEFEERDWESMVNFSTVSEKLGQTRTRLQCYQHWKAMSKRAHSPADSTTKLDMGNWRHVKALDKFKKMTVEDKLSLLRQIHDSLASEERWIPWKKINLTSNWTILEKRLAFEKLKESITPADTLQETVDALTDHFEKARLELEQDRVRETSDETQDSDDSTRKRKMSKKPGSNLSTELVAESDMSDDDHKSANETHDSPDSTDSEADHVMEPTEAKSDSETDCSNSDNSRSDASIINEISKNELSDGEADRSLANRENTESEDSTDAESSSDEDRVATSTEEQQKNKVSDLEKTAYGRQSESRSTDSSDSEADSDGDASTAVAEDERQDMNGQLANTTATTDERHGNNNRVADSEDDSVSDVTVTDAGTPGAPSMTTAIEEDTTGSSSADQSVSESGSDSEILENDSSKLRFERASSALETSYEDKSSRANDKSELDNEATDIDAESESALSDSSDTSEESGETATNKEATSTRNDVVAAEPAVAWSTEESSPGSEDVSDNASNKEEEDDDHGNDSDDEDNDDQVSKASRRSSSIAATGDELKASNSRTHYDISDAPGDSDDSSYESSSDDEAMEVGNIERSLNVPEGFETTQASHNDQNKAFSAGRDSEESTTDEEVEDPENQSAMPRDISASNIASSPRANTTQNQESREDASNVGAASSNSDNDNDNDNDQEEEEEEEEKKEERGGKELKSKVDSSLDTSAKTRARSLSDSSSSSSEVITLTGPSTVNRFAADSSDDESTSGSSSSSDDDSDDDTSSQDSTPWPWDKK